jgi:RHS repeat-associated protein
VDQRHPLAGEELRRLLPPGGGAGRARWFGSLQTGSRDASGQFYRRNRYYDANSGQFTQSDPIGVAGGLNTYGFAGGDPVSYSDPYGLCASNGSDTTKVEARQCTANDDPHLELYNRGDARVPWYDEPAILFADPLAKAAGPLLGRLYSALVSHLAARAAGSVGERVAERLLASDGSLRLSRTVAAQLANQRGYIPVSAILEAVRGGTRIADPQGVANHYMYRIAAQNGTLEVLVDESNNVINHVLYRSKGR